VSDDAAPPVDEPSKKGDKSGGGRFQPGNKAGPGRPAGSRNKATLALEKMLEDEAGDVLKAMIDAAKMGDTAAGRLLLDRVYQPRKGRAIKLDLPKVETAADVMAAMGVVVDAMAQGEISPDEATAVGGVLEMRRKSIETAELEMRIAALEARSEGK
jgi:hypothetical protein